MYPPTGCNNTAVKRKPQWTKATFTLAIILVQERGKDFPKNSLRCSGACKLLIRLMHSGTWHAHISSKGHPPCGKKGDRPFSMECPAGGLKPENTQYANIVRNSYCWNKYWLLKWYIWHSKVYPTESFLLDSVRWKPLSLWTRITKLFKG